MVDPREEKVLWTLDGLWRRQHDATLLPGGRLLVFDNLHDRTPGSERSRVVEVDPATQQVRWRYPPEPRDPARPLLRTVAGMARRLPNGNTLIVESTEGRALEVTPGHETVWEFHSPFRAGRNDELVAILFGLERIGAETPLPFLSAGNPPAGEGGLRPAPAR
ncbi:MAG TPA: arylsulfotransferase family protein [Vicinamibacteria bacterium]|nr:arylsulfotransferase family protein [Vicinamibacteria bacterium]